MNFAKKCKELRMKKGVTQEQMASALKISSQVISKWENGLTLPDITLLPEISVYFGVTIDELFDVTIEKHLARIQNMIILQEEISNIDFEYAQSFLLSQLSEHKNKEYSMQLLPALYNRKADEYRAKAEYYAKEALSLYPDNHSNHSNLNEAQQGPTGDWNLDNHAERILFYKEFLDKHPDSIESWRWYIGSLLQVGRYEEAGSAITILEKLYSDQNVNADVKEKKSLRAIIYRAQLLWEEGHREEALNCFDEITKNYSEEWLAWNCAADAYAKACRYDKAIEYYKHSMEVQKKPRYTDASMAIAQICEITGDVVGAIEAWEQYISILNEDWNTTEGAYVERARRKIQVLKK